MYQLFISSLHHKFHHFKHESIAYHNKMNENPYFSNKWIIWKDELYHSVMMLIWDTEQKNIGMEEVQKIRVW